MKAPKLDDLLVFEWKDIVAQRSMTEKEAKELDCAVKWTPGWIHSFNDGDYLVMTEYEHSQDGEYDFCRIPAGCVEAIYKFKNIGRKRRRLK